MPSLADTFSGATMEFAVSSCRAPASRWHPGLATALPLAFYEPTRSAGIMTGLRAVELFPNPLLNMLNMFIGV